MAVSATTAVQLAVGSFNATSTVNQIDIGTSVAPVETTTFGSVPFQTYAPGIRTVGISAGGMNDFAVGAWDEYVRTAFGTSQVMTLAFNGATVGTGAVMSQGLITDAQNLAGSPGSTSAINLAMSGVGVALAEGQVTQTTAANITATGTTTAVQLGALASTQSVVSAVHIFGYSGTGTVTFQLSSSATSGGAYTLRGTASALLSAAGGTWISATGLTVTDTWWRLAVTASAAPVASVLASIAIVTP